MRKFYSIKFPVAGEGGVRLIFRFSRASARGERRLRDSDERKDRAPKETNRHIGGFTGNENSKFMSEKQGVRSKKKKKRSGGERATPRCNGRRRSSRPEGQFHIEKKERTAKSMEEEGSMVEGKSDIDRGAPPEAPHQRG